MTPHLQSVAEVAEKLQSTLNGLTSESVKERVEIHGKNILEAKKKKTVLGMFLAQLADFMILFLFAAAIISGIVGELTDTIVILIIVLINAIVGVFQEWKAEKAIEALETMSATHARVLRDGNLVDLPAADLVPGDVVHLEAGNVIPADIRLVETHALRVDESSLTGESIDIEKKSDQLSQGEYALGDRINMGYKGTFVTNGRGVAIVVTTGMKTELGRIAGLIQGKEIKTPLQKRLNEFGKRLTVIIVALCVVFFFVGWWRGEVWSTMLLTSISLAVAAIPEALPALVTVALALGAKRLVQSNALIRKLPAVETLGSVTYICSDKTGTLTLNRMSVKKIFEAEAVRSLKLFDDKDILVKAIALNNDVTRDKHGQWVGESTEAALVQYASDQGYERAELENAFPRVAELPFDSKRKCMTTLHKTPFGFVAVVKGAVGSLIDKLHGDQVNSIPKFRSESNAMAEKGYRTLGYAIRKFDAMPQDINTIESDLVFIGVAGMMDPPRDEARRAVAECRAAGIKPVMITGDHKLTAQAIAKDLGILSSAEDLTLTGPELKEMDDAGFENIVERVSVYARVDPEQKLKIVAALQHRGHFVAMTGDGVNDAPALKNADIGVAMGINGTEVSKEAAHMILLDDNFATIVQAVKHGRRIFDNILKFIKYIMTGNSGEIWTLFLASFFGLPIPLLAIHILWINLITDGLPGLAMASEPSEPGIMRRTPRNPKANIFSGGMGWHILWVGLLMGIVTLSMQAWSIHHGTAHWQTMTFSVLCFSQLGHVLAIRSEQSVLSGGFLSNKPMLLAVGGTIGLQLLVIYFEPLQNIFKTQGLSINELMITLAASSIPFLAVECEKLLKRRIKQ